jgi:anaerobic magnesium-protoporphyrin IX monomethyl ester cyclase
MKKIVLLIYPNYYQYSQWKWIPTGLVFLAAVLKKKGFKPIIIDDRFSRKETLERIKKHLPKTLLVGISTATGSQLKNARVLMHFIKKQKNVPIVCGGPFPSALPDLLLAQESGVDYVIVGQGEKPLLKLTKAILSGCKQSDLGKIPRLYYHDKKTREIIQSKAKFKRVDINKMPALPYFDREIIDVNRYINPEVRAINYTTSSGCVGNCAFCYWHNSYNYSVFKVKRVINDLKRMKKEFGILNLNFDDPTFFIGRDRVMEIVNGIIKEKLNIAWRGNARIDTLKQFSLSDVRKIHQAGCDVIHVGLEHASAKIISLMGKRINPYDALKLLEYSKKTGIIFRFHLLLANPTEKIKDLKELARFIKKMKKVKDDFDYTINWFTPYPGCRETALAQLFGYIPPRKLDGFEKIELINYIKLPDSDRQLVLEDNPWKTDYKVPWFSDAYNKKYLKAFRLLIPEKDEFRTTGGKIESQYVKTP